MSDSLPRTADEFLALDVPTMAAFYTDLARHPLTAANVSDWLAEWTRVAELAEESFWRLYVAMTTHTDDAEALRRYEWFTGEVQPALQAAEHPLKKKLLDSGLEPPGFAVPLRNMRAEAALFREENLPLLAQEKQLATQWTQITGAHTVEWGGEEVTLYALRPIYQGADRADREAMWNLATDRWRADRDAITDIWRRLLAVRVQIARNAGLPDYRAYRWQQLFRFDYTPEDCARYADAIEQVAVPVATRLYEQRKAQMGGRRPWELGIDFLYPWSPLTDPLGRPPLRPFEATETLIEKVGAIFQRLDPVLFEYFDLMRREGLLDLESRPHKGPGAYCTGFAAARRAFIFMNAVGFHDDVSTLIHESGHAFHDFETFHLPYLQQRGMDAIPIEFAEVASMGMEYLAAPYLPASEGGFYSVEDTARARIEHLEYGMQFWPYMAVVDGWQHWAYTHPDEAADPARCDEVWEGLWRRFLPGADWSDLDHIRSGWQQKVHLFEVPFYYVEYGLAQMGAVQVWRNALTDPAGALAQYRRALSLGATVPLPDLFAAAGAKFAFDAGTLREVVGLMSETRDRLAG